MPKEPYEVIADSFREIERIMFLPPGSPETNPTESTVTFELADGSIITDTVGTFITSAEIQHWKYEIYRDFGSRVVEVRIEAV